MSLNKSQILDSDDLPTVEVDVPEWGGTVFVRTMSAGQRDAFEAAQTRDPYTDLRARLAVLTVCDDRGELLFTPADIPAVTRKSGKALDRVFTASVKLNKLTPEDIEELRGNS